MLRGKISTCILISCLSISASSSISRTNLSQDGVSIVIRQHNNGKLPPILKSKLGVARASGYWKLPESVSYTRALGSRSFCSTLSFDEVTDRSRTNYALGATTFLPGKITTDPEARIWLQTLLKNLHSNQQQIFLGLVGAPKPYQQQPIRKPAAHPTPTNIPAAAELTAEWARMFLPSDIPVNWVIWNEPEHTLRGSNSQQAAHEMFDIYKNYQAALAAVSIDSGFGLASFMKASLRDTSDYSGQTFAESVISDLARSRSIKFDYITLNSYHGGTEDLTRHLNNTLQSNGLDQPLVLNQFAPELIGSHPAVAGSIEAASLYIHHLDTFVRDPAIGSVCFSFWAGPDRKALLREDKNGGFNTSLPFQAMSWYQTMPLWRLSIEPSLPNNPYAVWASYDETSVQVLIAPKPREYPGSIPAGARGKATRKALRKELRQDERIQRRKSLQPNPNWGAKDSLPNTSLLTIQLPEYPDRMVNLKRLSATRSEQAVEKHRTDKQGRLILTMTPDQIALLSIGATPKLPRLLPILRTDLYIHRTASKQGWASVDAIHDGFVLAVPSKDSVAHASADYQTDKIRSELVLQLMSPSGNTTGRMQGLSCSALLIQNIDPQNHKVLAAWGSKRVVKQMMQSRAFMTGKDSVSNHIKPWGTPDNKGFLTLIMPETNTTSTISVHIASAECDTPTQLQLRIINQ